MQNPLLRIKILEEELRILQEENYKLSCELSELKHLITPEMSVPIEWEFTSTENKILIYLYKNKLCSREALLVAYSGYDSNIGERSVDTLIKRIRRNLKAFKIAVEIKTAHGEGYYISDAGKECLAKYLK